MLNETSYFGRGAREELAGELKKRNFKKVFLVSDKALVSAGVAAKVEEVLNKIGIPYDLYDEIKPNPTIKNVTDGVEACKASGADVIVTVGGGSSMDTAKAISIVMTNPDRADIKSLNGLSNTNNRAMPVIALPTTAGTASEVTINYVITDEDAEVKMVCVDPNDIPIVAIVDSELMESMPKGLAAATGMDALTHAVEGYITKAHNEMSDMFHMKAIKLIFKNLASAVNDKEPYAVEQIGLAQYIAGMAFSNVGLGVVHGMAHPLGAIFDIPHGIANALLLPIVMEYNAPAALKKYVEIAKAMDVYNIGMTDEDAAQAAIKAVKDLSIKTGIPQRLRELGIRECDLPKLAASAIKDVCTPGNPRDVTEEIILELYKKAF